MFAGKSTYLLDIYDKHKNYAETVRAFKSNLDVRWKGSSYIQTHKGDRQAECTPITSLAEIHSLCEDADVVLVDEIHFWPQDEVHEFLEAVKNDEEDHRLYVLAGISMDHRGNKMPQIELIRQFADNVVELMGKCSKCGQMNATHTCRKKGYDQEIGILVGGDDKYFTLCDNDFIEYEIEVVESIKKKFAIP